MAGKIQTGDVVGLNTQLTTLSANGVKQQYKTPKLTNWLYKLASSPATAKMIFVGDSTSDLAGNAINLISLVNGRTNTGDVLSGFSTSNMPNFGANGNGIQAFYDSSSPSGKGINDVITTAPDLVIFSYGINDVRQNQLTKAQLKTYLINIVNTIRAALPNTDIVLRMPNSFLTVSGNGYIQQGSYASVAAAAQAQTDILYYAYKELEGYWDNVPVLDTQNLCFGRTCLSSAPWMSDEIHPAYGYMFNELLKIIGTKVPFSEARARGALYDQSANASTAYATPWTLYNRVLEFNQNFIKVCDGIYNTSTAGSFLDITLNAFNFGVDAYDAAARIAPGDIVNIGDSSFFVLPSNASPGATTKTVVRISNFATLSGTYTVGTPVTVYRSIYNHTYAAERYLNDKLNYPYRRRVTISSAGSGFFDINLPIDRVDGLTKYDPKMQGQDLQLTTADVIVVNGQSALTLTSATFSPNGYLRVFISGTYTAYANQTAYIFGNHAYETTVEKTITATGTTATQTINKQAGTVNIAAAASSVTVNNTMVKSTSIVHAVIRTNDSTALIKNVVPANGSFVITLNAAATAETSIGFIVFN
jgi:hypothetical protein